MTDLDDPVAAASPAPATHLPDPLLIGLVGRAGAGKDTVAAHLAKAHNFSACAFADPIRNMIEAMLVEAGLDYAYIHERHLKEEPIPGLGVSYRELAQKLGTEWGRECIAPDLWIKLAGLALGLPDAPVHDRIVITDVRFRNEAYWLQCRGGVLVRVVREVDAVRPHVSETEVERIDCWRTIYNDGSTDYLHDQVDVLMQQLLTRGATL